MSHARKTLVVCAAVSILGLAACSSSGSSGGAATTPAGAPAATDAAYQLKGICPSTVVVQEDWEPEAEHSGVYELVGPGYTIDGTKKRVTGPLVIDGKDTGVKIQVRAGGSAIGYQSIIAQMYIDKSITFGAISTDGALSGGKQPTTAVVSQLNKSPQMLMWDPASHSGASTLPDVLKSKPTVVVSKGADYVGLLEDKGILKKGQIDQGYTGAPARFVSNPKIVQQGFATAEPYIYQHEIRTWDKPVGYQLLSDFGYDVYPEALSVRTGALSSLSPCLTKLVPILQQAQINYVNSPSATNKLITAAVKKYNDGWTYSIGVANYAAATMKKLGIVANDSSGPLGGMNMTRVQQSIDTFSPILNRMGVPVRSGLKASDIATDRFIDPSIKLGATK